MFRDWWSEKKNTERGEAANKIVIKIQFIECAVHYNNDQSTVRLYNNLQEIFWIISRVKDGIEKSKQRTDEAHEVRVNESMNESSDWDAIGMNTSISAQRVELKWVFHAARATVGAVLVTTNKKQIRNSYRNSRNPSRNPTLE